MWNTSGYRIHSDISIFPYGMEQDYSTYINTTHVHKDGLNTKSSTQLHSSTSGSASTTLCTVKQLMLPYMYCFE